MSTPQHSVGRLRTWWRRQQYEPGPLGWLVNPFYIARKELLRSVQGCLSELRGEVLDVGCGHQCYRRYLGATRYVGLDLDTPEARALGVAEVYYDGGVFPLPDASFDAVLCSQVFEHVFTPGAFLAEIRRVLRPGGRLVLTVPFVWDEHEQPRDFGRYTSFGLRAVLEQAGLEVISLRKSVADSRALFQLANAYLYKVTHSRSEALNHLAAVGVMAPVNLAGLVLGGLLPANPDFYLDNIVVARKPRPPG